MATPFRLKRSAITGKRPALTDLQLGELGINFYDGYLFARRETNGVGIADTVSLLNPWSETYGGGSIFYEQSVGIGSTNPQQALDVVGVATFKAGDVYIDQRLFVGGVELSAGAGGGSIFSGITTFTNTTNNTLGDVNTGSVQLDGGLGVAKNLTVGAGLNIGATLNVAGVSTYSADLDINADIDVSGNAGVGSLDVVGISTFGGIATFTDTTENTIGTIDTGAVKIAGGLAVAKNVTVGGGLSVTGNSYFVGMVTFAAGTNGNITLGDSAADNVVFNADVNSNFIPNTNNAYDLGSSSQQWKNLYVNGLSDLDFVNVSAASTFAGTIDANGRIVGAATSNVIPFLYSAMGDLPSASTYHGAFAHVHGTGKAYYAHANNWSELVSKESTGTIGIGTERLNVGRIVSTGINVSGITTTTSLNVGTGATIITTTQTSGGLVGINSTAPTATLDVGGVINSNTDITINGTSVLAASTNDAVALAIALG